MSEIFSKLIDSVILCVTGQSYFYMFSVILENQGLSFSAPLILG